MDANCEVIADAVNSQQLCPDEDEQRSQFTGGTLQQLQHVRKDADRQRLQH